MKPTVIAPKTTTRAEANEMWMNAPNPMVTFFKTWGVTPLYRLSRRRDLDTEIDGAVGKNSGIFNSPFLFWDIS